MVNRENFEEWILEALTSAGGKSTINDVSKFIWDNYKSIIEPTIYLYNWQYEMRWAATSLRRQGKLKAANCSPKGIWETGS